MSIIHHNSVYIAMPVNPPILQKSILKVYGGERRWLAGCLLLSGGADPSFQLRPLNVFFTERPDEEVGRLLEATFKLVSHPDAGPLPGDVWAC